MLRRILHDDLEYDGDFLCFEGALFTGVSYELFDNGKLQAEYEYESGQKNNECKDWYRNGQLRDRYFFKQRKRHGLQQEFHEDGSKKSESDYELGIELERRLWSKFGELIEHWKLDSEEHKPHYDLLLKRKKKEAEKS